MLVSTRIFTNGESVCDDFQPNFSHSRMLIDGKGKVEDMKNYTSREELENSRSFQDWFCGRHDEIDNAAHKLLCTIARQEIEWDAEMISKIAEIGRAHV